MSVGPRQHRDGGWVFWSSVVVGWAVIGFAVRGLLQQRALTTPVNFAVYVVGGAVVHDGVWIPIVLLAGVGLSRILPAGARRPVLWAAATSGVLTLIAWPFVRGYGRRPDNPSLLPRNYERGLLAYLAVTWVVALAWIIVSRLRSRRL